jgi:putative GTP pyrophosphokinase
VLLPAIINATQGSYAMQDLALENFLLRNNITQEQWEASELAWDDLKAIGFDHTANGTQLQTCAEMIARIMQGFPGVHSVRWRIKDAEHLMEKIIRKRSNKAEKYIDISVENYTSVVTDLIGVRALHLFKDDCEEIDKAIRENWPLVENETPIVYTREGDAPLQHKFAGEVVCKTHPKGYRSVHYIVVSQPQHRKIFTEVQVRTIFEEGWSEIDHRVRYPNFSDNQLVEYFLAIFNRLAGQADEMGSFVKALAEDLQSAESRILAAEQEREVALQAMESALGQLVEQKQQGAKAEELVRTLRDEVQKLKSNSVRQASLAHGLVGLSGLEIGRSEGFLSKAHRGLGVRWLLDETELANAKKAAELGTLNLGLARALKSKPHTLEEVMATLESLEKDK